MKYAIVEKRNRLAVHGLFDNLDRAEKHLSEDVPKAVARGLFMDKSLRAEDFVIVEYSPRGTALPSRDDLERVEAISRPGAYLILNADMRKGSSWSWRPLGAKRSRVTGLASKEAAVASLEAAGFVLVERPVAP